MDEEHLHFPENQQPFTMRSAIYPMNNGHDEQP